jgi:HlyD family secretion protein/epimerase transport system membrane fusion protein
VLEKRQRQHQEVIMGLRSQLTSAKTQMSLIAKERSGIESLYSAGYATLPRLLALERAEANLLGQKGGLEAAIAENILKKEETEIEILRLRSERLDTIASEMRESQRKEFELAERVRAAQDVVDRSIIVAPSSGKIVALSVFSSGEVIQPGAILMEVVPQNDQLIIEAHIDPNDADNLRPGMEARVRLNPFKTQGSPIVSGQVRGVSADRLMDEHNGQSYYLVEVELDRNEVRAALGGSSNLQPGLPAEVMISLGEHSPLEYLLAPLSRRVRHAMSEE